MTVTRQRIVILVLAMLFAAGAVFLAIATTSNQAEAAKAGGLVAKAGCGVIEAKAPNDPICQDDQGEDEDPGDQGEDEQ